MFWYIILFVLCATGFVVNNFIINDKKWQNIINILLVCLLCFYTGTRYNIGGYDYFVYERVYEAVPILSKFNFSTIHLINNVYEMEKGFLFLCSICKSIGFTYYGFNLICSTIFYTCFYIAFKEERKTFSFIIIIFLYKLFFFQTFVLTRQMLCIGIFFVMIKFIKDGKFIKYLFCALLASTIHITSLILIPVYFIRYLKITKRKLLVLSVIFFPITIISLLGISILPLILKIVCNFMSGTMLIRVENYINLLLNGGEINILNTIEYFLIMIMIILNYRYLKRENKIDSIYFKIFLILLPILTLFRGYEVLARVKDYFIIVYAFLIIDLCSLKHFSIRYKKYFLYTAIIIFCFAGYIRTLLVFDNGGLMPYNSYVNDKIKIINFGG